MNEAKPESPVTPALELAGVSVAYGGKNALNDISLSINSGETCSIIGPNGAGKSTLVRAVCGRLPLTCGRIFIQGGDAALAQSRKHLGIAPQRPALYEHLTASENVVCSARQMGLAHAAAKKAAHIALSLTGAEEFAGIQARRLSGGMRARVNIAAAIVHRPNLIILDEPGASLDPESARLITSLILTLNREGFAILLVSHDMKQVEHVSNNILILNAGSPVAHGSPATLRRIAGCEKSDLNIKVSKRTPHDVMLVHGFVFDEANGVWRAAAGAGAAEISKQLAALNAASVEIEWVDAPRRSFSDVYDSHLHRHRSGLAA